MGVRTGPSSEGDQAATRPWASPSSPTPHKSNRVTQLALDHCQEEKLEEVQALPGPSSGALPLQANTGDREAASTRAGSSFCTLAIYPSLSLEITGFSNS